MLTLAAAETIRGVAGTTTAITYTITGMELNGGTEAYKVLAQGQLPTANGVLYTTPGSTQTFVKSIHLANTTAFEVTGIRLSLSGTANSNLLGLITIPANGFATLEEDGWRVYDEYGQLGVSIASIETPNLGAAYLYGAPGFDAHYQTTAGLPTGTPAILFTPFWTPVPIKIRNLAIAVVTAPSAGTDVKFGIYRMGVVGEALPTLGEKIVEFANQAAFIATAGFKTFAANQNLGPGYYWLATAFKSMTGAPEVRALFGVYRNAAAYKIDGATFQIANRWRIFGTDYTVAAMPVAGTAITTDLASLNTSSTAQGNLPTIMEYWKP